MIKAATKAIRVLMEEKDLSVADIVSKTGWSDRYVSNCRTGKADPLLRVAEWAQLFGIPASELLARAETYEKQSAAKAS